MNGRPFYTNGFNAYWMMYTAGDPSTRDRVSNALQQAASYGLNVVRTWAFNDGGYRALQTSPGNYDENMFKALDFVISEAKRNEVYLILSLVNNWEGYGGKKQYVQWAQDQGQWLNSDDDFFRNDLTKQFYKNHIKAILTRVNSITGVMYKDDPTIFAWELMNEPRCQSDNSGATLQNWIYEMSCYVKSVDSNHLLEAGLEGFYGDSRPDRKHYNPGFGVGSDFIANNQIPQIDFTTIHIYPDQWINGADDNAQTTFLQSWITSHSQDAGSIGKPLLITEFGRSSKQFSSAQRDAYYWAAYNTIYGLARSGGACTGALFWQYLGQGMDNFRDGYEVVFQDCPSTASIISQQSRRIESLNNPMTVSDTKKLDKLKN
ncbi:putative mannan endo-1,4-beta-mannosidase 9 [Asparagus officinalis]|uniref:putative mannan endo-1,4-beta-mannosidase 9 n=1 Tax=Asparagus officinalis TaxID=4686 RepID=UPI00098E1601|nr:putative mannan endo-1,4-beta-mannosidase 9 [Asparagus officinalis]